MIFNYGILFDLSKLKWNLQEYVVFQKLIYILLYAYKWIVNPEMNIPHHLLTIILFQSSIFFFFFCWTWKEGILNNVDNLTIDGHHWPPYYGGYYGMWTINCFVKSLLLCSAKQRNSYRSGTTWGWVNDDNLHFWVNYPFNGIINFNNLKNKKS